MNILGLKTFSSKKVSWDKNCSINPSLVDWKFYQIGLHEKHSRLTDTSYIRYQRSNQVFVSSQFCQWIQQEILQRWKNFGNFFIIKVNIDYKVAVGNVNTP